MKKLIAVTTALLSSFLCLPAQAQYTNYNAKGTLAFIFHNPNSNLARGQEVTINISKEQRNIPRGTVNACGYRILAPGANTGPIYQVHPSTGAEILISGLPTFNGRCGSDGTLVPNNQGDPVPTSHYITADNKVAIKMQPDWNYLTVTYTDVTRKVKAGACGEIRYTPPTAKPGERPLNFNESLVSIPGVVNNANLMSIAESNLDGFCAQRWRLGTSGSMERIGVFFTN